MFSDKRILIFSGGNLGNWAIDEIEQGDFLVGADRGALFLLQHGIQPDYALGDFDSVTDKEFAEIKDKCKNLFSCNPVYKDYTDTEMAFNWALAKRPKEILLLGVTGTRFDHNIANIHLLSKGLKEKVPVRLIDEKNEITLIDSFIEISGNRFRYISILPFSYEVKGVTLEGFKYPLHKASLTRGTSIGISNELIEDRATINIDSGQLLVIRSMD